MERVMQMKKLLIIILVPVLILGGLFLWKGGHHAIVLADRMEQWLDADESTQSLTLMVQKPGISVDENGQAKPEVHQMTLNANTFWTEYADRPLFGLTAHGVTAYTDGKTIYMDTGKAYALPDLSEFRSSARKLAWGLLLHGRVTKKDDTYQVTMEHRDMELSADITIDGEVRSVIIVAVLPDDTAVQAFLTALPPEDHPIPQTVADAMVRAKMEPPMALTELLEVLIPALEALLPLEGELTLSVESGILKLSEDVLLRVDAEKAELERKGVAMAIELPSAPGALEPLPAALMLLRHGEFILDGSSARIEIGLPSETTGAICTALVPQSENLGIAFDESQAMLSIDGGRLSAVTLTAGGEVPFLVTTIPLSFHAELKIP